MLTKLAIPLLSMYALLTLIACDPTIDTQPNQLDRMVEETYSTTQLLPIEGPGLPSWDFRDDEVFQPISWIDQSNFIPASYPFRKDFGSNGAILLNGYFVSMFTPDSGKGPGGFLVLDIADPFQPKLVRQIYEPNGSTRNFREPHAYGLALIDDKKLMAIQTGRGIEIWDFTRVEQIKNFSRLDLPGVNFGDYSSVSWQLWWQHPYMYVAASNQGIFIVDTTDPKNPRLAERGANRPNPIPISELGGFRIGPIFSLGDLLVISSMDVTDGFATFDISDPLQPRMLALYPKLAKYYATCFDGRYLHATVRGKQAKLHSFDLLDPKQPKLIHDRIIVDEQLYCSTQDQHIFIGAQEHVHKLSRLEDQDIIETGRGSLGVNFPDNGQVSVFGNLLFIGNDHGSGSAFMPHTTEPDRKPPRLIRISPANGAIGVAPSARIGLAFSDNILPESLTNANIRLLDENGDLVPGSFSVQLGFVNFSPDQALEPHSRYQIQLRAAGVRDYAGNSMMEELIFDFQTGASQNNARSLMHHYSFDKSEISDLDVEKEFVQQGHLLLSSQHSIQVPPELSQSLKGQASVSFYLQTTDSGEDRAWDAPGLFGHDAGLWQRDLFWGWIDRQGRIRLSTGNDEGVVSKMPINDSKWHHIVMSRDSDSGSLQLYVDGIKQGSKQGQRGNMPRPQSLGRITPHGRPLTARIDELKIFDQVLTEDEVRRLASEWHPQVNSELSDLRVKVGDDLPLAVFDILGIAGSEADISWQIGENELFSAKLGETLHYPLMESGSTTIALHVKSKERHETWRWPLRIIHPPLSSPAVNSSPIVSDEKHFYLVNPDSDSVSAFVAASGKKLWEKSVGRHPRTLSVHANHIWVSNQDDDSLSILQIDDGSEKQRIRLPYGSAPYGLVAAEDAVFVSLEGGQKLIKIDHTGNLIAEQAFDFKPRGLVYDPSRRTLWVSRFISAPEEGEVWQLEADNLRPVKKLSLPLDDKTADGEDRGRGLANYLVQFALSPDGKSLLVPAKKDNILRGRWRSQEDLNHENTIRAALYQWHEGEDTFQQAHDFNDREGPVAIHFTPEGDYAFIALQGSNSIEIYDTLRMSPIGALDQAGFTPQGLSMTPDGAYLGIQSFLSRSILIYDLRDMRRGKSLAPTLIFEGKSSDREKLSAEVLRGKRIFYHARDQRMSLDGYISCASCHLDGGEDGQVWDFTERGEGLRNTISLRGRRGMALGAVHWTANFDEIQDFENDIRFGFGGTGFLRDEDFQRVQHPLGPAKAGLSADLDALAAYVSSLKDFDRSSYRRANGELSAAAQRGQRLFLQQGCDTCHRGESYTDNLRHDIGTIADSSGLGQGRRLEGLGFKTPSLRGSWSSPPYLHDGSARSVKEAILAHESHLLRPLKTTELDDMTKFILSID
ncbi:MAG: LamG-like jellyroll fold domain-containing protein [Oligoflexus sp.]